mmetsp:Transcript_16295/g.35980  ORF Transcript_16295/g.35980 Transcript_16295/m.35980 type:complete len:303 (-) Transcript_16295:945-1853(-)
MRRGRAAGPDDVPRGPPAQHYDALPRRLRPTLPRDAGRRHVRRRRRGPVADRRGLAPRRVEAQGALVGVRRGDDGDRARGRRRAGGAGEGGGERPAVEQGGEDHPGQVRAEGALRRPLHTPPAVREPPVRPVDTRRRVQVRTAPHAQVPQGRVRRPGQHGPKVHRRRRRILGAVRPRPDRVRSPQRRTVRRGVDRLPQRGGRDGRPVDHWRDAGVPRHDGDTDRLDLPRRARAGEERGARRPGEVRVGGHGGGRLPRGRRHGRLRRGAVPREQAGGWTRRAAERGRAEAAQHGTLHAGCVRC